MAVHPIDYRYGTDEMRAVWTEENKLRKMLEVEVALARAEEATGEIPEGVADEIETAAEDVTLERVKEIEAEIHHDVMASPRRRGEVRRRERRGRVRPLRRDIERHHRYCRCSASARVVRYTGGEAEGVAWRARREG